MASSSGGSGRMARVFTFAAGLSLDDSGAAQSSMPEDIYNTPYTRKRAILSGLGLLPSASASDTKSNSNKRKNAATDADDDSVAAAAAAAARPAASLTLVTEPAADLDAALIAHDPGLVAYLSTAWERWDAMPADHRVKFFQHKTSAGTGDSGDATPALIPANLSARHDALTSPGASVHAQTCYYHTDMDTPIFADLLPTLKGDMAVVAAVAHAMALETSSSNSRGSGSDAADCFYYALVSHPGHHAGPSNVGGYCYLNNVAVLARTLLQQHLHGGVLITKVAVLDVDYHAGNGTAAIFWNDPNVFVASIHADPDGDYPWNSGHAHERGGGAGLGTTISLPLAPGTAWPEYSHALSTALAAIKTFEAQVLIVSLGLDTYENDPVQEKATAGVAMRLEDYTSMGAAIAAARLPTVFVQEGGYQVDVAGEIVANVFRGMQQQQRP